PVSAPAAEALQNPDLSQEVADLQKENVSLKERVGSLEGQIDQLKGRFEDKAGPVAKALDSLKQKVSTPPLKDFLDPNNSEIVQAGRAVRGKAVELRDKGLDTKSKIDGVLAQVAK